MSKLIELIGIGLNSQVGSGHDSDFHARLEPTTRRIQALTSIGCITGAGSLASRA